MRRTSPRNVCAMFSRPTEEGDPSPPVVETSARIIVIEFKTPIGLYCCPKDGTGQANNQEKRGTTAWATLGKAEKRVLVSLMDKLVHTSGFGCCKHRTTAFATLSGDCMLHDGTCLVNSDSSNPLRDALFSKNSVVVPIGCTELTCTPLCFNSIRIDFATASNADLLAQ